MSLFERFPHTCVIYRQQFVRTPGNVGNVEIPSVVFGDDDDNPLVCWVQNASSNEIIQWEKRDTIVTHRCNFLTELAIELGDEIRITAGPAFVSNLFSVRTHPVDRTAGFGLFYTAMVEIER